MNIKIFALVSAAVMLLASCGDSPKKESKKIEVVTFPEVAIPVVMQDSQEIIDHMVEHWWDGITEPDRTYVCDSTRMSGVSMDVVEQKFANWIDMLGRTNYGVVKKAMSRLYNRAYECEKKDSSSNVFEIINTLMDKYLYDPNSPLRNEDFYAEYAQHLVKSDLIEQIVQGKYEREVRLAALNKTGSKAADFRFVDIKGKMYTLYGIKADLTLLFFSNPGCGACKDIIDVLNNDPMISGLISDGRMAVLNIYIDEDLQAWKSYMSIYPESWYNAYDPDMVIRGETLYNVRAIPSLYILDSNKTVIMKDAPEPRVFEYLSRYAQQ